MRLANCLIITTVRAFGIVIAFALASAPVIEDKPAMAQSSRWVGSPTPAFDPDVYYADLQRRLKKHWFPPRGVEFKSVVVLFKVHAQGELSDLRIGQSSGVALVDNAALKAVEDAAPFRPLPIGAPENVDIKFEFPTSAWLGGPAPPAPVRASNVPSTPLRQPEIIIFAKLTPEADFGPYMADLQRRLKKHWFPPQGQERTDVTVAFTLQSDGSCSKVSLKRGSGRPDSDDAALSAVRTASPFRPLPSGAPATVDVQVTFDYKIFNGVGSGVVVDPTAPNGTTPGGQRQVLSNSDRDRILGELNSQLKPYESVYQAGKSTIHQMWDGKHMRIEIDDAGQRDTIIFDFPSKMVISLLDSQKKYFKMPMTAEQFNSDRRKQTLSAEQQQTLSAKQLGSKFVNGHPCHGYEYRHDNVVSTIWMGDDTQNMMVQFEESAPTGKSVTLTSLKSYREGVPLEDPLKIPDSFIEMKLPAAE